MIAIIDYGMGNIHSVQKALEFYGAKTLVTNKVNDLKACQKIVLPGVGAFDEAVLELSRYNLIDVLKECIKSKKVFLGICLGMQLLFETSEEAKSQKGLGILKGKVKRFDIGRSKVQDKTGLKIPHIGWNRLEKISLKCPLLKGIPEGSYVYFCHSYYPKPEDKKVIVATCNYGIDFTAIVWQENLYGVQFHPEKSQTIGLQMLKNFISL